jgi:hypothetical protein
MKRIAQMTIDATEATRRPTPCPTRFVHIATIARTIVAEKNMNPKPNIQKVRHPRIKQIQPALTADDFATFCSVTGRGGGFIHENGCPGIMPTAMMG